ncbi:hypothetical protein E3A20_20000 [Planctomyces bekefii]|uniref:Carboxypeptidase regulatory-like domain-containing protein n=1 Tax=Planctomyces bekefii TaxID=1653850 RepID=A0A5C6M4D6_9PLAN|nr:hypothetical protein E3A20_20000 [Planctomyces bekefii]
MANFVPPKTGVYNIVGSFGVPDTATVKATAQRVEFTAGGSLNVGKIEGQKVALVTARIVDSVGTGLSDVAVRVLGSQASGTSREEGLAALAMGIPAGTYQIEFQKSGYQTLVQDLTVAAAEAKVLESVVLTAE